MEPVTVGILVIAVATCAVGLSILLGDSPGEKRTYLFETAEGERDSPFAVEDVETDAPATCRSCHTDLPVASYRYCRFCVAAD